MTAPRFDDAIVYGIAPFYTSNGDGSRFKAITGRIPRLAELGVNCLWLQPVYANHGGGQGYDTTDYFALWKALGSEDDLHGLIRCAHASRIRVLFDFVPNHTSRHHPFAQDVIRHGRRSRHYDFYMHEADQAPYATFYNVTEIGGIGFVRYFWDDLLNINLHDPAARSHLIEAAEYWVRRFDIDGYRVDTAWGPRARRPDFFVEMRRRLRAIKPDILLIGEDRASAPEAHPGCRSASPSDLFDVVYDWAPPEGHIYKWSWQRESKAQTIFNAIDGVDRVAELRASIDGTLRTAPSQGLVLRFIENNDTPRFISNHTPEQTRMAATLAFTLPGVPLIYYGQEVGTHYDYPSFERIDHDGDWDGGRDFLSHYRELIRMRRDRPELSFGTFEKIAVAPAPASASVFAFSRSLDGRQTVVAVNLGGEPVSVRLDGAGAAPLRLQPFEARIC